MLLIFTVLRVILAMVLILFFPGYLLVNVLFPKKRELDEKDPWLVRLVFSVVLSIAVFIGIGFFLNSLGVNGDTGKGYFSTTYILISLGVVCLVLFVLGIIRGAYPVIYDPLKARVGNGPDQKKRNMMELLREVGLEIADMKRRISEEEDERITQQLEKRLEKLTVKRTELMAALEGKVQGSAGRGKHRRKR